jgi:hypothetical protein
VGSLRDAVRWSVVSGGITLTLVGALSGCGSAHSNSASAPTTATKAPDAQGSTERSTKSAPSTTTTTVAPLTAAELDQGACRAYLAFYGEVHGSGDQGSDALGVVGGMIQQAQAATQRNVGHAASAKLLADLQSLLAFTQSSQWTGTTADAAAPQFAAVSVDCRAFPTP